jgi:hypothetical protein
VGIVGINTPTGWYLTENGLWINSYPNLVEVVGNCANLAESAAPPTPVMPTVAPSSSPTAILVELPPSGGSGTGGSEDDSGGDDETPWAATATPAQWSEAEARAMWGLGDDAALTRLADAYFVAKPVSTEANATFSVRNPLSCQVDGAWIDKKGEYQYGIPPGKKVNATQATILRECPS